MFFDFLRPLGFITLAVLLNVVAAPIAGAQQSQVEIRTQTGIRVLTVELALTRQQQSRGLMFRKNLPDGHGMLF